MTRILIIEDELQAAQRIEKLVVKYMPDAEIIGHLTSIEEAIIWFENHKHPDLIFLDIHLSDGLSFNIFKAIDTKAFIIFTTAYDEYALDAFQLNSVDYLLKPISEKKFAQSIEKYQNIKPSENQQKALDSDEIVKLLQSKSRYKHRFLVDMGSSIGIIPVEEIAYFAFIDKNVQIITKNNQSYKIKDALDKIESEIEAERFFRINRQLLVSASSIVKIHHHFNYKLKLELKPNYSGEAIISKARVNSFKAWISGLESTHL